MSRIGRRARSKATLRCDIATERIAGRFPITIGTNGRFDQLFLID